MLETEKIKTFLPHSGKMFLLSRVLDYSIEKSTMQAEYDVTENCVFYDNNLGGVPSWVGFEIIAQSAAALFGIRDSFLGLKPKIGLLLSVSSLKVLIPIYKKDSTISIRIKEIDHTDAIYTFEGEIYLKDELAIKSKLMTLEVDEKEAQKLNLEVF